MPQPKINPEIKETKDGSSTLYSSRFGQHYHNPNGAVAESRHVFFETPGLPAAIKQEKELSIFEVGFGTGLNMLLCLDYLHKGTSDTHILFTSVEAYPVDSSTAKNLAFGDEPFLNQAKSHLVDIFENAKPGMNRYHLTPNLTLQLFCGFFEDYFETENRSGMEYPQAGFIFHDPFSPEVNNELWTPGVFKKLAIISNSDAILATYCAASSARASMATAGWNVARAKGALGKREMTVASLSREKISPFKRVNEKRLIERYKRGDFDF